MAANACVNLDESVAFWSQMADRRSQRFKQALEFFSTHPSDARRLELLRKAMPLAKATWRRRGCDGSQREGEGDLDDRVRKNFVARQPPVGRCKETI